MRYGCHYIELIDCASSTIRASERKSNSGFHFMGAEQSLSIVACEMFTHSRLESNRLQSMPLRWCSIPRRSMNWWKTWKRREVTSENIPYLYPLRCHNFLLKINLGMLLQNFSFSGRILAAFALLLTSHISYNFCCCCSPSSFLFGARESSVHRIPCLDLNMRIHNRLGGGTLLSRAPTPF